MAEESTRSPVRLMNFVSEEQAAVAVQSMIAHELKETPPVPVVQEQKAAGKKNPPARPIGMIIKVKPQAKKARLDQGGVEDSSKTKKTVDINTAKTRNF
ncbi:hypothetical protein L484_001809 [Morus notabilis]|uniref:Uncharacterized protein n=1 Tax=Morus notabilis TaxID=981085 RepID=W9QI28_9ROSA|nr:hypothetical protein L484_001809 [Morus notabilis]